MQTYTGLLRTSVSSTILIASILLLCLVLPDNLVAQLPGTISYQGQILGEDQHPVPDGLHRLDVALYDAEDAAEPLWQESHLTEFSGGLFSIYLGSITPIDLPFDRQYFLGVSYDGHDEMSGRTPLSTSPYAVRSNIAGEIEGGSVRSINGQQGDLKIIGTGGTVVTESDGVIRIGTTLPKSLQGGPKVEISPSSAQTTTGAGSMIHLNETGSGTPNMIELESEGSDVFLVENDGDLTTTGSITAEGGSFGDERLQNVADPTAAQDAATKSYVDTENSTQTAALEGYADQAEADAKAYSDAQDAVQTSILEAYANQVEADANAYSDAQDVTQTSNLEAYADQAEADANAYSDAQDAAQTSSLEAYADQAEADANAYSDAQDAIQASNLEAYVDQSEADAKSYSDAQNATQTTALQQYSDQSEADANAYADQQDAAQNVTAEPFITFDAGSATLTNNRVLAAGTGVSLSDAGADNGGLTVAIGQNVATTATPTFDGIRLDNLSANSTSTELVVTNSGSLESRSIASLAQEINGSFWTTQGNGGTTAGPHYIGTSDAEALHLCVNGGGGLNSNSLILNTDGSIQRDRHGDARGEDAIDLQIHRDDNSEVASGVHAVIGGGEANRAAGSHAVVDGGQSNEAFGDWTMIGGGRDNRAIGDYNTVGGGRANYAEGRGAVVAGGEQNSAPSSGEYSAVGGGKLNRVFAPRSVVPGGYGMTLMIAASGSFGFLGGNTGANGMTVTESNVAVFGNTDLWLANNDGSASSIRFYEANSTVGTFPSIGLHYTEFRAGDQLSDISYTLPTTLPTEDGHVLSTAANGTLSWVDAPVNAWHLGGNAGTTAGTDFIGTTDQQGLHLYVNGGADNGVVLNVNGSIQRDADGNSRGDNAVDLQISRSTSTEVASSSYSVLSGGRNNTAAGAYATVGGGLNNIASNTWTTVAGGARSEAFGWGSTVGGGNSNQARGTGATVGGGFYNTSQGAFSAIPGGRGLTLSGGGSFGFLGDNISPSNIASEGTRPMTVSESNVAVFGNTDMWLANNNNQASELRFYESNADTGAFPNTTNYTAFVAGNQTADITYTLPTSAPTVAGQVLGSTTGRPGRSHSKTTAPAERRSSWTTTVARADWLWTSIKGVSCSAHDTTPREAHQSRLSVEMSPSQSLRHEAALRLHTTLMLRPPVRPDRRSS